MKLINNAELSGPFLRSNHKWSLFIEFINNSKIQIISNSKWQVKMKIGLFCFNILFCFIQQSNTMWQFTLLELPSMILIEIKIGINRKYGYYLFG